METSETPTFPGFKDESMCSAQASPASLRALPGSEEARRMTVGSGRQLSMLLDQSSPLGAFSKILLESLAWTSSEEFSYVWSRLDTKFGCSAFQLTALGQSIDDNGSLLLQTPVADDAVDRKKGKVNSRGEPKLSAQVKLWRTPTGTEDNGGGANGEDRLAQGHTLRLRDQVKTPKLWPTPTVQDGCNNAGPSQMERNSLSLNATFGGSLNPRFVCELMGFPADWTELRSETAGPALKPSATPSVRNKPARSSRRSRKQNKPNASPIGSLEPVGKQF